MPRDESPQKHIPTLLDEAITARGTTITALAREWGNLNGTTTESKRRLLQKYRKGESVPDEESARQLALLLHKPGDHFVTERRQVSRRDLDAVWKEIAVIHDLIANLRRALEDQ